MIKSYTKAEVKALGVKLAQPGKYPWSTTEVGGAFFVPRSAINRDNYILYTPKWLKPLGYSIKSIKRPAFAKPTRNFLWSIEVDPNCVPTTSSTAWHKMSKSSPISLSTIFI